MPAKSPFDPALAPLRRLAAKYPDLETQVIWEDAGDWDPQEDEEQHLDPEEIEPYAEGLLAEGFSMAWQVLGDGNPEFLRLFFWQGVMPALPEDPAILDQGRFEAGK